MERSEPDSTHDGSCGAILNALLLSNVTAVAAGAAVLAIGAAHGVSICAAPVVAVLTLAARLSTAAGAATRTRGLRASGGLLYGGEGHGAVLNTLLLTEIASVAIRAAVLAIRAAISVRIRAAARLAILCLAAGLLGSAGTTTGACGADHAGWELHLSNLTVNNRANYLETQT